MDKGKPEKKDTANICYIGRDSFFWEDKGFNKCWELFELYLKTRELSVDAVYDFICPIVDTVSKCDLSSDIAKAICAKFLKPEVDKEKIVEKLNDIGDICVNYDGYRTVEGLKGLIDDIKSYTYKSAKELNEDKA